MLRFKKLNPNGNLTRGSEYAAGYDLYAISDYQLEANQVVRVKAGIAIEIPTGYVGIIRDRSSLGSKGIHVFAGVIDSDYRGEIVVCICNLAYLNVDDPSNPIYIIKVGDKIAQMVIIPCFQDEIEEVEFLTRTKRGDSGFGSTGK